MKQTASVIKSTQGNRPLRDLEVGGFVLSLGVRSNDNRIELSIRDSKNGYHQAKHTNFVLLDDQGAVLGRPPITAEVADFILRHFHLKGHTESFNIYASDLEKGSLQPRHIRVEPDSVRHNLGKAENNYTATGNKLLAHWPIFHKLRDTNHGSIIRATMTNHQVCASRCHFCSTIARNRSDSITLEEAKRFVETLYFEQADFNSRKFPEYNQEYYRVHGCDIRLRGLILSGGGQPNLWPHFPQFVRWLSDLDIDLGLITNGFPRKIPEDIYEHFQWVRISVTPPEASPFYPDGKFERQYIPASLIRNPNVTVGYSYVDGPWADDQIYLRLNQSAIENGFEYVRTLADCNLGRIAQLQAHKELSARLHRIGLIDAEGKATSRTFHQLKYHGDGKEAEDIWQEGQCYLQAYNVFWDTTGHEDDRRSYCYACDSVTVLADDPSTGSATVSERRFNPSKWGTVHNDQVARLFREPLQAFFDPRKHCRSCLFARNNAKVKQLMRSDNGAIHVPAGMTHLSFP